MVDINQVIERLMMVVGPGLSGQGIHWECSLADELPSGPGNPQKWQQIILNLVNNAKEAMPSGGQLKDLDRQAKSGKEHRDRISGYRARDSRVQFRQDI